MQRCENGTCIPNDNILCDPADIDSSKAALTHYHPVLQLQSSSVIGFCEPLATIVHAHDTTAMVAPRLWKFVLDIEGRVRMKHIAFLKHANVKPDWDRLDSLSGSRDRHWTHYLRYCIVSDHFSVGCVRGVGYLSSGE